MNTLLNKYIQHARSHMTARREYTFVLRKTAEYRIHERRRTQNRQRNGTAVARQLKTRI